MIFGTKNARDLKKIRPIVAEINRIEAEYESKHFTDEDYPRMTESFKKRVQEGESLDHILPEAYALVKNACRHLVGTEAEVCGHKLVWDMIPFDCQLVGGIVLHQGKIAEMQTGEGKTLVATLPLYLNALAGKNVQLVTVNDYLARRDASWMGHLYRYLGLTVGCIQNSMESAERREQYRCDITYGTNSEFGFDYLRDNGMAVQPSQIVQNGHAFAIVDEVDSILIDEARTPLIISGPATVSTSAQYQQMRPLVESIVRLQTLQCNGFIADCKKALSEGDTETAKQKIYQVYHSMPKHKQMLHLFEDPAVRKLHEQVEMQMLSEMYRQLGQSLKEKLYFTIDERTREVALTDLGCDRMNPSDPSMFVIPDLPSTLSEIDGDASLSDEERTEKKRLVQTGFQERSQRVHIVTQLLRAYCLYERDVDYVVQPDMRGVNHVYIVDEFTGRILPGRRWSDGLHQAVEAKEGVEIEKESQTLATITIQNYFRLYKKLAGMTGTAETEAREFKDIYKLDVVSIPTNKPVNRIDGNDQIYRTQREKFKAIIADVRERHEKGQPVLLGTVTVDTSEILSRMLKIAKIPHEVLNAKNHAREAEIVALAGQKGAVTIATNMAGRGTDIKLGPGVKELGGLHVLGSERHESRRIDRQLRGRCSRQGDPGSSQFFISLEDNLMRLFGSQRISGIMERLGMKEGEVMEHRWLNKSVETAQRRVEQQHYAIRKRTLEFDDVMNKQRAVVYEQRGAVLTGTPEEVHQTILDVFRDMIESRAERSLYAGKPDFKEFALSIEELFPVSVKSEEIEGFTEEPGKASDFVYERVRETYENKCRYEDPRVLPHMERGVFLQAIDRQWQDYLRAMDDLRSSVNLRAYGQRDPLVEYKREAFDMFERLMDEIKTGIVTGEFHSMTEMNMRRIMAIQRSLAARGKGVPVSKPIPAQNPAAPAAAEKKEDPHAAEKPKTVQDVFASLMTEASGGKVVVKAKQQTGSVGRNDPCPCGSGKKYKKCCGKGA